MGIIMNKKLFLDELHRLLSDLPPEERNQAIKYYEDYFEDAGPENEQAILKELGSPQELANQIKATTQDDIEYGQGSSFHRSAAYPEFYAQKEQSDSQNENNSAFKQTKDGFQQGHQQAGNGFNNNGYRQTGNGFNNNSYQQAGNGFSNNNYKQAGNGFNNNSYWQAGNGFNNNSYQQAGNGFSNNNNYKQAGNGFNNNGYRQTGNGFNNNSYQQAANGYNSHYQQQSTRKVAWIVLFALLAITIGLPCLSVLFGILLAIFSVIVSIVLALFGTGGGLMIGGIASFFGSFFMTAASGTGAVLFTMGIGLVLFAIGALIIWIGVLFCIRFLPALFQTTWKSAKSVTLKFQQWIKKRW